MSDKCILLGSFVSSQQRFGVRGIKALGTSQLLGLGQTMLIALRSGTARVTALREISVTALFYLEDSRRIHPRRREERGGARQRAGWGWGVEREKKEGAHAWGRQREWEPFGSFFYVFFSPRACPMQVGLRPERCSTWSPHSGPRTFLWPSSVLFSRLFPSLSFSHRHFGVLFPILTT